MFIWHSKHSVGPSTKHLKNIVSYFIQFSLGFVFPIFFFVVVVSSKIINVLHLCVNNEYEREREKKNLWELIWLTRVQRFDSSFLSMSFPIRVTIWIDNCPNFYEDYNSCFVFILFLWIDKKLSKQIIMEAMCWLSLRVW